jgi:TP901 family phage tail tape measure protein
MASSMMSGNSSPVSITVSDDGTVNKMVSKFRAFNKELQRTGTVIQTTDRVAGKTIQTFKPMPTMFDRAKTALTGMAMQFISAYAGIMLMQRGFSALSQFIKDGIKNFRSFETQLAEVRTLFTETESSIAAGIGSGLEELSKTYGMGVSDLTEGLYDIISAAVPAEKALNLLTTSTRAAIAGISDVSTSVDIMTSILNAYGMQAEQMTAVSDKLFMTIRRGKLRFEDLANAMGYIAPIAANLGVELDEVLATLSTVTRQGLHADMATRGLALAMQNFADVSPQSAEAAEKYGVEIGAATLSVKGFEYVINQLRDASKEYGLKIIPQIVRNMRSLRVIMALVGDEGARGLATDLQLLEESTGRTDKALTDMMNTQQKWADMVEQTMQQASRSVGEGFSGVEIWFTKVKTWWATLIAKGFNIGAADAAIQEINDKMSAAGREAILAWANPPEDISGKTSEQIAKMSDAYVKAGNVIEENSSKFEKLGDLQDFLSQVSEDPKNLAENLAAVKDAIETIFSDTEIDYIKSLRTSGEVENFIGKEYDRLNSLITENTKIVNNNVSAYNSLVQPVLDAGDAILELEKNIMEAEGEIDKYETEISDFSAEYSETVLKSFQKMANMAITYGDPFKRFSSELADGTVIDVIKEQAGEIWKTVQRNNDYSGSIEDVITALQKEEKATQELADTTSVWNDIIQRNNLELMKLRLKEMQSRHGLRRGDELKQQRLQISNQKQRIKIAQQEIAYEDEKAVSTDKYRRMYDELVARWSLSVDEMKNNYQTDYSNFDKSLTWKEERLKEWQSDYEKLLHEQYLAEVRHHNRLAEVWGASPTTAVDSGLAGTSVMSTAMSMGTRGMQDLFIGNALGRHQRGSFAVPYTGLHLLHRGEEVVPRGSKRHGSVMSVEIKPITVNARITQETDARAIGSKIGEAIASGFVTGISSEFEVG